MPAKAAVGLRRSPRFAALHAKKPKVAASPTNPKTKAPKSPVKTATAATPPATARLVDPEFSQVSGHRAVVAEDDNGHPYDVLLVLIEPSINSDKFCVLQLIENGKRFTTFSRWGRTGLKGQTQSMGPYKTLEEAAAAFAKKFKEKTANTWQEYCDGNFVHKPSKYDARSSPLAATVCTALSELKGEVHAVLEGHSSYVYAVAISPDDQFVVTGSMDNTARIWSVETGETIKELKGHSGGVRAMAISPDGKFVITGSRDSTARIWSVETGETIKELKGHFVSVNDVAISPDSKFVVTGSYDHTARIWSVETGETIKELKDHAYGVLAVAISSDGKYVVTGSWDKTARIWY